jgi:hypothetical protein
MCRKTDSNFLVTSICATIKHRCITHLYGNNNFINHRQQGLVGKPIYRNCEAQHAVAPNAKNALKQSETCIAIVTEIASATQPARHCEAQHAVAHEGKTCAEAISAICITKFQIASATKMNKSLNACRGFAMTVKPLRLCAFARNSPVIAKRSMQLHLMQNMR